LSFLLSEKVICSLKRSFTSVHPPHLRSKRYTYIRRKKRRGSAENISASRYSRVHAIALPSMATRADGSPRGATAQSHPHI